MAERAATLMRYNRFYAISFPSGDMTDAVNYEVIVVHHFGDPVEDFHSKHTLDIVPFCK